MFDPNLDNWAVKTEPLNFQFTINQINQLSSFEQMKDYASNWKVIVISNLTLAFSVIIFTSRNCNNLKQKN